MTEVPEHLLKRSQERREALGLATSGGTAAPEKPDEEGSAAAAPAAAAPAAPAGVAAVAPAPAPPPAVVTGPTVPESVYRELQAVRRNRVPMWVMPVLFLIPFWGVLYFGAFGERTTTPEVDPAALGAELYRSQGCAGCHGNAGEGGTGPALANGEAAKTFPDAADHANWIRTGSAPFRGQPYGNPDREGGQRIAESGGMPPFPRLTPEEINAIVTYERESL